MNYILHKTSYYTTKRNGNLVGSLGAFFPHDSVQDVLFIANDWQTGLLPVYHLYKYRRNNTYRNSRCVFVIHNIGYQAGMSAQVGNVPRFAQEI